MVMPELLSKPATLNGEVISRSQIGHEFIWPKQDPRSQWQPSRTYEFSDDSRIRDLGRSPHFNLNTFLEKSQTLNLPAQIIELLNHNNDAEQMEIHHEITVIGNPVYTKVVDKSGLTQFYELSKFNI